MNQTTTSSAARKRARRAQAMNDASLKTLADLLPDPENPRDIESDALSGLRYSLEEFGDLSGITFNLRTKQLVCGHQRVGVLREEHGDLDLVVAQNGSMATAQATTPGGDVFPVRLVDWDLDKQRAANLAANSPAIAGHFTPALQPQLEAIRARSEAMFAGLRLASLQAVKPTAKQDVARASLAEKFLVPPFSILDTRQGYWQQRKQSWKDLGIQSEVGRGANLLNMSETVLQPDPAKRVGYSPNPHLNEQAQRSLGFYKSEGETLRRGKKQGVTFGPEGNAAGSQTGTSIFDPVLAEIAYRWFCPEGGGDSRSVRRRQRPRHSGRLSGIPIPGHGPARRAGTGQLRAAGYYPVQGGSNLEGGEQREDRRGLRK